MVDAKDIDTLSSELENRLDALFGENDIQLSNAPQKKQAEHYPLAELKNLILSIDWEITDEVLDNLLQQLKDLQLTYEHDKIVTTFLQILKSLGTYIRTHRAKAHPKTFKILNSVFVSLDKVVLSKEMTAPTKKKILRAEMNRYKELRVEIAKSKAAAATKRKAKQVATQAAEIKYKKEEAVLRLDEPSVAPEGNEKKEEPVLQLDEPSVAPEVNEKKEEPVLQLDEPSVAPEGNEKEEEPVLRLGEPSVTSEGNEKEEEPVLRLDEPSAAPEVKEKAPITMMDEPGVVFEHQDMEQESVLTLAEPSEPSAVALEEGRSVIQPDSERDPAVATLADAVEEIKQYIHTEINALKKEIQLLRDSQ